MVEFKYLVANYIWVNRSPYGTTKEQIMEYMKTIENVSYPRGVEHSMNIILEKLVDENLIAIHGGNIFVRLYAEKWDEYIW